MTSIEVSPAAGDDLAEPLALLEESSREGEPLPERFTERLRGEIEGGGIEVLVARTEERTVGVAVISYRPNVSAAADFASIEELYVRPDSREQGVGRALMKAIEGRCAARGVSYVEVQTDEEAAPFYAALGYEEEPGVRLMSRSVVL